MRSSVVEKTKNVQRDKRNVRRNQEGGREVGDTKRKRTRRGKGMETLGPFKRTN